MIQHLKIHNRNHLKTKVKVLSWHLLSFHLDIPGSTSEGIAHQTAQESHKTRSHLQWGMGKKGFLNKKWNTLIWLLKMQRDTFQRSCYYKACRVPKLYLQNWTNVSSWTKLLHFEHRSPDGLGSWLFYATWAVWICMSAMPLALQDDEVFWMNLSQPLPENVISLQWFCIWSINLSFLGTNLALTWHRMENNHTHTHNLIKSIEYVLLTLRVSFFLSFWVSLCMCVCVPRALKCKGNLSQSAQAFVCFKRHDQACRGDKLAVWNRAVLVQRIQLSLTLRHWDSV